MRCLLWPVLVLACAVLLPGCAGYQDPGIAVTGAKLSQVTDEAAALSFDLDLHNPNNEPLTLLEFEYELSVDGKPVFKGMRAAETVLASLGSKHVSIPGVVPYDKAKWDPNALPPETKYSLNGRLRYVTPGKFLQVLFDLGVRRPTVKFSDDGVVTLTSEGKVQSPNVQNPKPSEPG